ncbi:MAG: VCBS domain-containing protein, partial [Desulfoplanes sp.]|nr:VCBS domain-containing protein [Desulfoplanes sp.]
LHEGSQNGSTLTKTGTYGTLTLNSETGAYTYAPDSDAINALSENATDIFEVNASDGSGSTATQSLNIEITAANDFPIITPVDVQGSITEGSGDLNETGSVSFTDVDLTDRPVATETNKSISALKIDTTSLTLTDAQNAAIENGFSITNVASNTNNGTVIWGYSITENQLDFLAENETVEAVFTITLADGKGGSASQDVTVNITGTNDAPDISIESGNSAGYLLTETDTTLDTSGTLSVGDLDTTDIVNITTAVAAQQKDSAGNNMTSDSSEPDNAQLMAMLAATGRPIDSTAQTGTINWNFNSGRGDLNEAFNYLAQGEKLVLTYTLTATDSQSTTDTQNVTLTITGTNDDPSISTADPAGFTELPDASSQELNDSGTVSFNDVDSTDVIDITFATNNDIAWNGGTILPTLASQLVGGFSTTATDANAPGNVNWTYSANNVDLDFLATGETITFSYTLTATDSQAATATDTVSFTITGTNEDPTISTTVPVEFIELIDASKQDLRDFGTVSFNDMDSNDVIDITFATNNDIAWSDGSIDNTLATQLVSGFSTTATDAAAPGSATWTYAVNDADLDFLAEGETITFSYTITATDNNGASDTNTVSLSITGTNDVPVITVAQTDSDAANLIETDGSLALAGTLSIDDLDRTDVVNITEAVAASQLDVSGNAVTSDVNEPSTAALLDMFAATLQPIDGTAQEGTITWDFDSNGEAFNYLAQGEQLVLTYTLTATDSQDTTDTQDVTVTITGSNDVPVITLDQGDSDSAAITETDAGLTSTGTLSVGDLDRSDVVNITEAVAANQLDVSGNAVTSDVNEPNTTALLDMFAATLQPIDGTTQEGTITWNFDSTNEAFNYLAQGEKLVLTYTLTVTDSQNTTDTQDVTVIITGTNEVPIITIGQGDSDSAAITETDAGLTSTGTLSVGDLDRSDVVNITEAVAVSQLDADGNAMASDGNEPDATALLNMFAATLQPIDGTAQEGTITWDFDSTNEAFNYLAQGEKLVLTYTLTATDSQDTTDTQDVIITITGTNDAPVFSTVTETDTVDHAGETTETISTFTITESPDETSLAYDGNENYAVGFYVVSPKDSTWVNMRSFYNDEANVTTETYTTQLSESPDVDLLVVYLPNNAFTETEIQIFEGFLDTGGRIFFVGEHQGYAPIPNSNISTAISALGGNISILGGSYTDQDISNSDQTSKNLNNSPLTAGITKFAPACHAQLQIDASISHVVMTDDDGRIVMADQALSKGRVTVIA